MAKVEYSKNTLKLYKYISDVNYLESYCKQEIWLSPIKKLNDPFEGRCRQVNCPPDLLLKKPDLFDHYFQTFKKERPDLTRSEFIKIIENPDVKSQIAEYKPVISLFKDHGVLSLTLKPDEICMWTYYANNHQGFCIEFELDFEKIPNEINFSENSLNWTLDKSFNA